MKNIEQSPTKQLLEEPLLALNRRNAESKLLALMTLGSPTFLAAQLDACITARREELLLALSSTSLTQAKYQGIAFTNLACRAASDAEVTEHAIEAVRSDFSHRYATLTDPAKQWNVAHDLLLRLSEEIQAQRLANCGAAVRQCGEYIDQRFYCSVSLTELSKVCGLSAHYVSDLFRAELGLGALQYAHQIKLQHARFLLEHSSLGISAIASALSYPSHSNFSQRFRKTYGVTPHQYRVLFSK